MKTRNRLLALIVVLAIVAISVTTIATAVLYKAAFRQQQQRLVELVGVRATAIEADARDKKTHLPAISAEDLSALVLEEARDVNTNYMGLGASGEFMLARREGESIVYLFRSRYRGAGNATQASPTIPWSSLLGEPMRLALSGRTGTSVGKDYLGVSVLAAYRPVASMNLGIVAKINLAEVRAPFLRAAAIAGGAAIVLVAAGALLLLNITRPIIEHGEHRELVFRSLFTAMNEGVATHQLVRNSDGTPVDYVITNVNPRYEAILGIERSQVIGRKSTQIYGTPEAPYLAEFAAVATTGRGMTFDTFFAPMAKHFHVSVVSFGRDTFATIFSDITESRRLRQERDGLFNLSLDLLCVASLDGRFRQVNPAFMGTLGWSETELLDSSWLDLVHPNDHETTVRAQSELAAGRPVHNLENRYRCKDGMYRWLSWNSMPLVSEDCVFCVVRDVTDLRRAEDALRKSNEWTSSILESISDAFLTLDDRLTVTYFNKAAAQLLHCDPRDILGRAFVDALPDLADSVLERHCRDALRSREFAAFETNIGREADTEWCDVRIYPCESGIAVYFQVTTERRRALDALAAYARELEQKNAEMEQFVYTVSHDLKSPLVTIQGFAGHIRDDAAAGRTDRLPRFVEHVQNAATRMRQLIDDLLDLSRIGRVMEPHRPIAVTPLVTRLVSELDSQLRQGNITVRVQPDMPAVTADPTRLLQIFQNLLVNAVEHGATATAPAIDVGAVMGDSEIRFFVRDNGPGVASEHQSRIFEIFQRLDARSAGTGVGLAIVKRAAELHGGRAWVESPAGEGATFWVAFPKSRLAAVEPAPA